MIGLGNSNQRRFWVIRSESIPGAVRRCAAALLTSTALVAPALPAFAQALPTAGSVASGAAVITSPSGTSVLVTQSSTHAIINWGSFSIGAGNSVRFENGAGATLNRVTGLSPSQIDGSLSASGSLYLVNSNGITVGPSGRVTTGGSFVASTHDISDAAFNAGGDLTFRGASTASVINYGTIGALGGDVALIARKVENTGTITAPNGTVGLAAGYEVMMRDAALSDGKFVVKVGGADTETKTSGVIRAAEVELKANGGNVYALAGNTGSITKATGVASKGGRIFLTAGETGTVNVTQTVSARGPASGGKAKGGEIRVSGGTVKVSGKLDAQGEWAAGGTIVVTARDIELASGADLDARGTSGGVVLVGGDYQGGGNAATKFLAETVATAKTTTVAAGAIIRVDGTDGAGGRAVVWADDTTVFSGTLTATATGSAAGGLVETSGHTLRLGDTVSVSTLSEQGQTGTWLIDPYNVTISSGGTNNVSIDFNTNPMTVAPLASGANLLNTTLSAYLASSNVAITTNGAGSEAGNITVDATVSWSAATTLSLLADASTGGIFINANITGTNSGSALVLSAGSGGISQVGGTVIQAGTLTANAVNGGSVSLTSSGNLVGTLGASGAEGSFAFTNGQSLTLSNSITSNGTLSIATSAGDLTIDKVLSDSRAGTSLTLTAAGNLIIRKNITQSGSNASVSLTAGGSYSLQNGARVSLPDSGATLAINGQAYTLIHDVSALQAMGSTGFYAIANDIDASATASWNSGAGFNPIGSSTAFSGTFAGLGHIIDSLTINQPGAVHVGLFGLTSAATLRDVTLSNVAVTGFVRVGALVGYADNTLLENIHIIGSVAAMQEAGGIAGWLGQSTLNNSSSAASVTVSTSTAGGLVGGALYGTFITNSYSTGAVSAPSNAGGILGQMTVTGSGFTLTNVYASGQVTGTNSGGLVGTLNDSTLTLTNTYWDSSSTGQSGIIGANSGSTIVGAATDVAGAPRTQATYSGLDFTNTWVMFNGETRPMLRNEYSTVIATPAALQLMALDLSVSYALGGNINMASALAIGSNGSYGGLWGASGFVPVGSIGAAFTGGFNGQSHTITGLVVNRGGTDEVGLFGYGEGATLSDVTLSGGSFTGRWNVGSLIGNLMQGTVSSVSTSATVSSLNSALANAGGLIGQVNAAAISNSSATGDVFGEGTAVGGLVGNMLGAATITQSYATGNVTGTGTTSGYVGGLVGSARNLATSGNISQSYATGTVTAAAGPVGGFVGFNDSTITDSYATGRVNGAGATYVGGFVGLNFTSGTITNAYSTGYVTGATSVGAFAGSNGGVSSAFTSTYWNTQTSGLSVGVGGGSGTATARTTAQLQGSLPAGFSSSIWATGTNLYPYFSWRYSITPVAVSGVAYSDAGTTALQGATVTAVSGGSAIGSGSSGANGYYYILAPGGSLTSSGVLTYLDNGTTKGAAFSDVAGTNGIQNVSIYGTAAHLITGQSTLSATQTNYLATRGSYADTDLSFLSASGFAPLTTTSGYGVYLNPTGSYTLDGNLGSSGLLALDSGGTFGVSGTVTLSAAGPLTIADAVSWSDASSLALSTTAGGNITLASVTATSGTLTVSAGGTATPSGAIDVGTFRLDGGTWRQLAATLPDFAASDFILGSGTTFLRATGGDGSVATPYQIADVYGLQGMNSDSLLSDHFILVSDIDASGTSGWNSGAGFTSIGSSLANFLGTLDGDGHSITGLYVSTQGQAGLFGVIGTGAAVSDLSVAGDVSGAVAGVLAAYNSGTITNVTTSGTATNALAPNLGFGYLGGLVGSNHSVGAIFGSSSSVTVTNSQTNVTAGGLVGTSITSTTSITDSFATGSVTSTTAIGTVVGGLVGTNNATLSGSYATGNVSGGAYAGGLTGHNSGSISNSFATGSASGATYVGGLTGRNVGAIANAYATGAASGGTYGGGFAGENSGTVSDSYSTGAVTGATFGGGFIGNQTAGTLSGNFWNVTTSGTAVGIGAGPTSGVSGLTTAQMSSLSTFTTAGWDIDDAGGTGTVWRIYDGHTLPLLRSFMASLTVTGGSGTKTYDGSATSADVGTLTYSPSGYDTSLVSGTAGYTASSADAGTYTGTGLSLSGLYSSQFGYDISFVSGSLTIAQAGLTVTANDAGKTYDGAAYSGGNGVTYTGFVGGDTSSSLGGTLAYGGTSQGAVNAGTYSITASGLTSTNYAITYASGTLTVGTAALTVTANDASKTYDGAAYSGGNGVTYSGFVGSDTSSSLGGTLAYGGSSQGAVNAGTYSITASGLTSGNYAITYAPGTLTVGTAALTVTANNASKVYDATAYSGGNGVSYSGFVGSDTSASLGGTLTYGGTAQGAVNAGSYSITASGLTSGNYAITYAPGTLTLSLAGLTVTADAATMHYGDGQPALTYVTTGTLYGGDTLSGALTSLASSTSNVGSYAITQGTLTASSNYVITYVGANISVTPRPLSVTATGQSMIYGNSVPALTYTVGGAGLVNGDTLSGALATSASPMANVGLYAITQGTLAASSNYMLTFTGADMVISPRSIIVTADNASRPVSSVNPAFTYTIGGLGLANGDQLTGALTSDATLTSLPGRYAILQGTLAAGGNYALTYVPGELTVIGSTQTPVFVETSAPDQVVLTLDTDSLITVIDRLGSPPENTPAPRLTDCGGSSAAGKCVFLPVAANLPASPHLRFGGL